MPNNTAAIYIRLSVEDEDKKDESESIKNQRAILVDYAQKRGWRIFNIYCDEDFSGLDSERPAFKKLIEDAERGLFNIILCKSQSRFTRDIEAAEKYINRLFFLWNIRFISLTDGIDSFNKSGKKARQINSLINEWYCEDLSESVNAVFKSKMQRGEFIGSFAPYGYKKMEDNKSRLEADEYAASIVKEIFRLYIEGNGMKKIAAILTDRGILTPTEYKKLNGEKFYNPNFGLVGSDIWSASTIRNILKNPVYIGDMVQGKTKKISYKSKKVITVKNEDRIRAFKTHKGIIDIESFEKAAQIMSQRSLSDAKSGLKSVLSGIIKCGKCGCRFQRGSLNREKNGFYYRCSLKYKSSSKSCSNEGILNNDIENEIFLKIKDMKNKYIGEEQPEHYEDNSEKIKKSEMKILEYDNRLLKLYDDFSSSILNKDEFFIIKKRIAEEKLKEEKALKLLKEKDFKDLRFDNLLNEKSLPFILAQSFLEEIIVGETTENNQRKILLKWKI